jgi:uncharacterized protein (TIGR00255 family)
MTGYGCAEEKTALYDASVEIKGYNNRFLDIDVSLSPLLSPVEGPVREYLAKIINRGKIEAAVHYRENGWSSSVSVNGQLLKAYWKAALDAAALLGTDEKPSLTSVLEMEGVLETEKGRNSENARERIMNLLEKAAAAFEAERVREGEHTQRNIYLYVEELEKSLEFIASKKELMEDHFKKTVHERFTEMLGNKIDENRILAETAVLLVKYTIAEEVSRLQVHLKEFRALAQAETAVGKKLDFLCQEINREVNTIASKSQELEISARTVRMKSALENIREQLRNIE